MPEPESTSALRPRLRHILIGLVVFGAAMLVTSAVLVRTESDRLDDRFEEQRAACAALADESVDCSGQVTDLDRTIRAVRAPREEIALLGLATIAIALATIAPTRPLLGLGGLAGGGLVLSGIANATDYASCDDPGYTGDRLVEIVSYEVIASLAIAWGAMFVVASLVRLAFPGRSFIVGPICIVTGLVVTILSVAARLGTC